MEQVSLARKWVAVGALALMIALIGLFAATPAKAFAATDLVAGGTTVTTDLDTPTISYVISPKAGKLTVTVSAPYTGLDGYEYRVARDAAFTQGVITVTKSGTSATFTGLAKGKKYYVQSRWFYTYTDGIKYYSNWCASKTCKVAIAPSKCKIVGKWKLLKSTDSKEQSIIKRNKRVSSSAKYVVTFTKKGKVTHKDFTGTKYNYSWAAASKKAGYYVVKGTKAATVKISGKKLLIKFADGSKWTLARI